MTNPRRKRELRSLALFFVVTSFYNLALFSLCFFLLLLFVIKEPFKRRTFCSQYLRRGNIHFYCGDVTHARNLLQTARLLRVDEVTGLNAVYRDTLAVCVNGSSK